MKRILLLLAACFLLFSCRTAPKVRVIETIKSDTAIIETSIQATEIALTQKDIETSSESLGSTVLTLQQGKTLSAPVIEKLKTDTEKLKTVVAKQTVQIKEHLQTIEKLQIIRISEKKELSDIITQLQTEITTLQADKQRQKTWILRLSTIFAVITITVIAYVFLKIKKLLPF